MTQFKLVGLVGEPTTVTINSSSQIDVLLTTDIQFFGVFPFSGSDHCIIFSHFYVRGFCVDLQPILLLLKIFKDWILINRALKSGSVSDWASHRKLRNKPNTMLRSAKAEYFSDLASSLRAKPAKFWKHFQSLSRCSRSVSGSQAAYLIRLLPMLLVQYHLLNIHPEVKYIC